MGVSTVLIKVFGCDWQGREVPHEGFSTRIPVLPAAILEVQIRKVEDQDGNAIEVIFDALKDVIRTIDLRETAEVEGFLKENEESQVHTTTGTDQDKVETNPLEEGEEIVEQEEVVRFQYDGDLTLSVQVEHSSHSEIQDVHYDQLPADIELDSFHVIDFMTIFSLRVELKYTIPTSSGVQECNIVSEDHNVTISSGLGIDRLAGFDSFYEALSTRTKLALTVCAQNDDAANTEYTGSG